MSVARDEVKSTYVASKPCFSFSLARTECNSWSSVHQRRVRSSRTLSQSFADPGLSSVGCLESTMFGALYSREQEVHVQHIPVKIVRSASYNVKVSQVDVRC